MNLQNSHPSTESAEGIYVHNHHVSSRCWPTTTHHRLISTGLLPRGLVIWGVVPTSTVRILVDLCLKSDKRSLFKEQMPSSGFLKEPVKKPEHSFLLKNKINLLSGCFSCIGSLSAKAKSTRLLSAFSSQKRVAFVLIRNLYTHASATI